MLPANFPDKKICIIGMGYVGLTLAVAMADAGFTIHGVETDPHILQCLSAQHAHFSEVGLNERLAEQIRRNRMTFSSTIEPDSDTSVYIVTVGTPVGADKRTNYHSLRTVLNRLAEVFKSGDMIILRSTVRVGVTADLARPILAAKDKEFDLAFCPERTLEGKALIELRTLPQVIGGIDAQSSFRASQMFSFLTPSIVRVRNAETAEMVKLINNTQRDMVFAFANEVAEMCDTLGISANEVIASGNLGYPRANLPYPGPVGGPCLEKDPYILAEGLEDFGFTPQLSMLGRTWNEGLAARSVRRMKSHLVEKGNAHPTRIAILGSAFKGRPETDDLRGSPVVAIIDELKAAFPESEFVAWDPIVSHAGLSSLGLIPLNSVEDAFSGSSLVVLQNNHVALERLKLTTLSHLMTRPGLIYDFWHQHNNIIKAEMPEGVHYGALGAFDVSTEEL